MKIVVKVGTSTLAHASGRLNIRNIEKLCKALSDIQNAGHQVVLVSSGAIGLGTGKLNLRERPVDMPTKQAAAAVGQCELMYTYDKLFAEYNHTVAQILLTGNDVLDENRRHNVENTLNRLVELGAIPIINENDTVSTDEINEMKTLGENDALSAIVAISIKADVLVILSDIDGLYTADPHKDKDAKLIEVVTTLDDETLSLGTGPTSNRGTGGMRTKLLAAKMVTKEGIDMVIINGSHPSNLYKVVNNESAGTRFIAKK